MRKFLIPMLCIGISPLSFAVPDKRLAFNASSFSYSESFSVKQIFDDLKGPTPKPGKYAFTHNEASLSYSNDHSRWSTFIRYDLFIKHNTDTAELLYRDKKNLPLDKSRIYDLYIKTNESRAYGIKYQYQFAPSDKLNLDFGVGLLLADRHTHGSLTGQLQKNSAIAKLDWSYESDTLLHRPNVSLPIAKGYTLDMAAHQQLTPSWAAGLLGKDVISSIRWNKVPFTTAQLDTNNTVYDSDGNLISVKGSLNFFEGYRTVSQHYPKRWQAYLSYQNNHLGQFKFIRQQINDFSFHQINWKSKTKFSGQLALGYYIEPEALSIGWYTQYTSLQISLDDIDWQKSQLVEINLSASVPF